MWCAWLCWSSQQAGKYFYSLFTVTPCGSDSKMPHIPMTVQVYWPEWSERTFSRTSWLLFCPLETSSPSFFHTNSTLKSVRLWTHVRVTASPSSVSDPVLLTETPKSEEQSWSTGWEGVEKWELAGHDRCYKDYLYCSLLARLKFEYITRSEVSFL